MVTCNCMFACGHGDLDARVSALSCSLCVVCSIQSHTKSFTVCIFGNIRAWAPLTKKFSRMAIQLSLVKTEQRVFYAVKNFRCKSVKTPELKISMCGIKTL